MATAGYKHLTEEYGSPAAVKKPWIVDFPETSLRDASSMPQAPHNTSQMENTGVEKNSGKPSKSKSQTSSIWRPKSDSGKYKPMRPTAVRELNEHDVEGNGADHEDTSSKVNFKLKDNKEMTISKVHVTICALLISCVVLVAFATIYVFIILPSNKAKVLYPDGKTHSTYESQVRKSFVDVIVDTTV